MQFAIRHLFLFMVIVAWVVKSSQPGGVYVSLPLGFAVLLLTFGLLDIVEWAKKARGNVKIRFYLFRGLGLILTAFAFVAIYLPFYSYAASRNDVAVAESKLRHAIKSDLDCESVRADGQQLLIKMTTDSIGRLEQGSPLIPQALRKLDPIFIENQGGCLHIQMMVKREKPFCLKIFMEGARGFGTERLAPGVWFCDPNTSRTWINDVDWDAGVRP